MSWSAMQTDAEFDALAEANADKAQLDRMEHSIEEINARIARLAIALGISLDNEDDLASVLHAPPQEPVPVDRRADRHGHGRPWGGLDRRVAHTRQELRGLIVLRYDIEKDFVDRVGAPATRKIMIDAEAHLAREGFKAGADGVDLEGLTSTA
jgi:hypothetical protein